ncbi:2,4-dienoyl-CoA reductase-like NADH-dependent reductase (Old Yellow Enzyme family) [Rhizobium esperanzae]|uniref:2,4-dienoyl-CoA reductase-like NADH-dependent reductase (Old Yellow Enzyme family) n=1 Tax=Rhizobium esperanzae TaxID=1967781 RepID=A0A7W6R0D6_9HYPH|nr:2,4-dienoyl-CoA reductase-like NADH-dependent reductase (Old Yellow Enzyme family) [Rhizobium esperanzae]
MIVVEPMQVHPAAVLTRGNFRPGDDNVIPHFRKVATAIKQNGAIAIRQLYHGGAHGNSGNSHHPHWSPSGSPCYHDSEGSHSMSEAEIWDTIDCFVQAARRCRRANMLSQRPPIHFAQNQSRLRREKPVGG